MVCTNYKIFICLFVSFLFFSCASTGIQDLGVYDETVPESELFTLHIAGGLHVNTFNGKRVDVKNPYGEESLSGWGLSGVAANLYGKNGRAIIKLPAGRHELICGYYEGNFQRSEKAIDFKITYDFEAGKSYLLTYIITRDYGDASIFLQVEKLKTWP